MFSTISTLTSIMKPNKTAALAAPAALTLLWHYTFDTVDVNNYLQNSVTSTNSIYINKTTQLLDATTKAVGTSALRLTNTYVSVTDSFTVTTIGLSFAFWFKTDNTGAYSRVFTFESDVKTDTINFLITGNNKIGLSIFDKKVFHDYFDTYNYTVNDGVWRHIVWTIQPNKRNVIYINGKFAYYFDSDIYPASVARSMNSFGNNDFTNPLYTGWIDDFRIYSGVLTSVNVSELYLGTPVSALSILLSSGEYLKTLILGLPTPTLYLPFTATAAAADWSTGSAVTIGITETNAPVNQATPAVIGYSKRFTAASSQYITLPNYYLSTSAMCFTVSFHFRMESPSISSFANLWCISDLLYTGTSAAKRTFAILYVPNNSSTGEIRWEYAQDGSIGYVRKDCATTINVGQWYHLVAVSRADGGMSLYMDGAVAVTNASVATMPSLGWTSVLHQIGKSSYNGDPYGNFTMDDFRFYNDVQFTSEQVTALYNSRTSGFSIVN
jgi:hypothetical protein